ncbi:MAG: TlpA disulfide reductase family protein [Arenimonas sp.]|jgi:thiol-disulfide isomerase/thioredoxin
MNFKLAACFLLLMLSGPAAAKLEVGVVPPDLLGSTPDKEEIRVSQFKGTVVVVTFWASWCGPCLRELPELDVLQRAAGDRIRIVAVNVKDSTQDYRNIRRQLKDTKMIFTHDRSGRISHGYAVNSYPNLYVIDQTGTIAAVRVGFGDDSIHGIIKDINKLLAAPPQTPAPVVTPATPAATSKT